jgi:hypothetical protein
MSECLVPHYCPVVRTAHSECCREECILESTLRELQYLCVLVVGTYVLSSSWFNVFDDVLEIKIKDRYSKVPRCVSCNVRIYMRVIFK